MSKNETKTPFFARFLEDQKASEVRTGIKAGFPPMTTQKWPSDDDEGGWPI